LFSDSESSSTSLNSRLRAPDRGGVWCGVESECDGRFLDWFLSPVILWLCFSFFAFPLQVLWSTYFLLTSTCTLPHARLLFYSCLPHYLHAPLHTLCLPFQVLTTSWQTPHVLTVYIPDLYYTYSLVSL
jgi:hypothetical protein